MEPTSGDTNPFTSSERRDAVQRHGEEDAAASGDTNPFTTSELLQRLGDAAAPGDTNAFMSSELRHSVQGHREAAAAAASGDTNPFTASELLQRLGNTAASGDTNPFTSGDHRLRAAAVGVTHPEPHPASVRIILEPASTEPGPVSVDISLVDGSSPDGNELRRCVVLDAAPEPRENSMSKLAIAQSSKYVGFTIQTTEASATPEAQEGLHCRLFFDPGRDRMVIMNMATDVITAERLGATQETQSIGLNPRSSTVLEAGMWGIFVSSGRHVLDFSILSRRHVSISRADAGQLAPQGVSKRPFEQSQPPGASKRGKYDKGEHEDDHHGTALVFQSVPAAAPAKDAATAAVPSTAVEDEATSEAIALVTHPLEQLAVGDKAQVIGLEGKEYVLTRGDNIATTANTKVFRADHSQLPEKLAVVKVIRTPTHDVDPATPDQSATRIQGAAEMWLREYKHHSRLCQHTAVVRLHEADARFLSLYLEHVDAPPLSSHRERRTSNPLCTLNADEASRVLADMATALFYIHDQGIVHNDIKPANILYSQARGAVLIDFGLSSEVSDTTVHMGGSPWYVPPEYAITGGRGTAGDVYALGVVMLFLLRKLPLPEMRSPPVHWIIADVRRTAGQRVANARAAMESWGRIVEDASDNLDSQNSNESLVGEMLEQNTVSRIGMRELLDSLA